MLSEESIRYLFYLARMKSCSHQEEELKHTPSYFVTESTPFVIFLRTTSGNPWPLDHRYDLKQGAILPRKITNDNVPQSVVYSKFFKRKPRGTTLSLTRGPF